MRGRTTRILGLALALGLAAGPALGARLVDPASAQRETSAPLVTAQDAELSALAAAGRATELAARLERIAHDATLPDVAREWLLDRGLHALARTTPTPAARASVARLAASLPVVFARIDPDHGDRATPLYDTGATARFVLREWDRAAARDVASAALAAGRTEAVARFAAAPAGPAAEGIADAFRSAPPAVLAGQRAAVADALAAGRRVDALALILAERLPDAALFGLVFDYADEPVALEAIPAAARALDPASALERPAAVAAEIRDTDTDVVVYRAHWERTGASARELAFEVNEALVPGGNYRLWVAFNKPMRIRNSAGNVVSFTGQSRGAEVGTVGLLVGTPAEAVELEGGAWLGTPGGAPDGFQRYADDAFAVDFTLPDAFEVAEATPAAPTAPSGHSSRLQPALSRR